MVSSIGSILMLHRTAPYVDENIIYNENMKFSPVQLDSLIVKLKRKKRIFIGLDEVSDILRARTKPKHKFIALTLDDGYRDNLTDGYPIFKSHNVPFCIYVTNSFPNQTSDLWWFALERLLLDNAVLRSPEGTTLNNGTRLEKEKNFLGLREIVLKEQFKDPLSFFKQLGELNFDLTENRKDLCLTWSEIKELNNDPLVTIGSHTVNHLPLARLDAPDVAHEITASKNELEQQLKVKVKHFAFPFGSIKEASEREYNIASAVGFDTIVTTLHGNVYRSENPQQLDRLFLSPLRDSSFARRELFWNIKSLVSTVRKIF